MQSFKEFLNENYEINEEDFNNLDSYTKRNIEIDYEVYIEEYIK